MEKQFVDLVRKRNESAVSSNCPKVEYEDIQSFEGRLLHDVKDLFVERRGVAFYANDVLFGKLRPYLGNWFHASFQGVAVGDWWVLKPTDIDSSFLYVMIQSERFQRAANQSAGSKMPRADWHLVSELEYLIPQSSDEQRKIGTYFHSLDALITAREKALGKFTNLKKAMQEKMFPRAGAKVPEVRFKGFEGEWEEKRLGDLGSCQSGEGFPEREQGGNEGVPFFKVSDMNLAGNERQMVRANNYVTESQIIKNGWHLVDGGATIFFAKVGAAVLLNRKRLVCNPYLLDNNTMAFKIRFSDSDFMLATFLGIDMSTLTQTGTLPSISPRDVEDFKVCVPALPEQQKIGTYFRSLDMLIAARRDEVGKLKDLKKALLDRMFV